MNWVSDEYKSKHDLEKIKDNLLFIRDSVEKFSDITNFLENKKEKIKVGEISKNIIFERKPEENDPSKMSPENKFFYLSILFPLDNIRESTLTDDVSSVFFPESKFSYLSLEPDFNHELLVWKDMKGDSTRFGKILKYLNEVLILLNQVGDWKYESLKNSIWNYANNEGKGNVLWPMRIALSGKEKSPDPFKLAEILGRDETLKRIKKTIYLLENKNIINANSQSNNIDSITNNTVTRRNSNK
jgi:glutamyl/glutaminyl-tRNA synthetase